MQLSESFEAEISPGENHTKRATECMPEERTLGLAILCMSSLVVLQLYELTIYKKVLTLHKLDGRCDDHSVPASSSYLCVSSISRSRSPDVDLCGLALRFAVVR